jgi:hypothetical protein
MEFESGTFYNDKVSQTLIHKLGLEGKKIWMELLEWPEWRFQFVQNSGDTLLCKSFKS